jgi:hypothetical protein
MSRDGIAINLMALPSLVNRQWLNHLAITPSTLNKHHNGAKVGWKCPETNTLQRSNNNNNNVATSTTTSAKQQRSSSSSNSNNNNVATTTTTTTQQQQQIQHQQRRDNSKDKYNNKQRYK